MSIALLNSILLRVKTDPNLSAKGSPLTWDEEDTNFVIIRDALSELSNVDTSGFTPYNAGTTYSNVGPDYVSYNGNIYEYINAVAQSGITPGSDPLTWQIVSLGQFAHEQNKDQYLDLGGPFEVSAEDVYNKVNEVVNGDIFVDGGNSFGANASIGTNDAFDLLFRTNNTNIGGATDAFEWMFGVTTPFANTHKSNKSLGNTSGSYAEKWQDSDGTELGFLRNDGLLSAKKISANNGNSQAAITASAVDGEVAMFLIADNLGRGFGMREQADPTTGYGIQFNIKSSGGATNNTLVSYSNSNIGTLGDFILSGKNIGIFGESFASGDGVIFIANATSAPSGSPSGGGILYVDSGALKYKGSSGTVTTIAVA